MDVFNDKWTIPLGSLFGIPVRLHMLFLVVLGLQMVGNIYYGATAVLIAFLLLGPILLITITVHELGHSLAAKQVGGEAHGILLWPLGGLAFIGHRSGPKSDLWVALAGPLTHLPMIVFWVLMLALANLTVTGSFNLDNFELSFYVGTVGQILCLGAIFMNMGLMLFNLLVPAYPLDGGRILIDLLLICGVSHAVSAGIAIGIAVPIGAALVAWGIWMFQAVTILVGGFILVSSFGLFQSLRQGRLQDHPMYASCPEPMGANKSPADSYYNFSGPEQRV